MATGNAVTLLGNTARLIFTHFYHVSPLSKTFELLLISKRPGSYFLSLSSTFPSTFLLFSLMSPIIFLMAAHAHGAPSSTSSPPFSRVNFFSSSQNLTRLLCPFGSETRMKVQRSPVRTLRFLCCCILAVPKHPASWIIHACAFLSYQDISL